MPKHHSPIGVVITTGLSEEVTAWTGECPWCGGTTGEPGERPCPESEVHKKDVPSGQVAMELAREDPFCKERLSSLCAHSQSAWKE